MLPDLPLELWHRILECTCTCSADNNNEDGDNTYRFNCTTPRVLSSTCHELRQISRHRRFHSVTLRGWERLLEFEKLFVSTVLDQQEGDGQGKMKPYSNIVYLHVEIGEFWNVVYPHRDDGDGSEASEDSSYCSTSEFEGGLGPLGSEDDGEELTEERALDFAEISEMELAEVAEEAAAPNEDGKPWSWFERNNSAQTLSYLLAFRPTPLARIEFIVYSALRRLLEACAPTLEVLSLSWKPISMFFVEAVFPLLPELKVLCWDCDRSGRHRFNNSLSPKRLTQVPLVFPALQHLDIKANDDVSILQDILLMSPDVRVVTLAYNNRRDELLIRNKKVRIRVGSFYRGDMGLLDKGVACKKFNISSTMQDNDFYAIPATKVHHLSFLLGRLAEKVENRIRDDDLEGDEPRIQHGIDVCMDLMQRFDCS